MRNTLILAAVIICCAWWIRSSVKGTVAVAVTQAQAVDEHLQSVGMREDTLISTMIALQKEQLSTSTLERENTESLARLQQELLDVEKQVGYSDRKPRK